MKLIIKLAEWILNKIHKELCNMPDIEDVIDD